MIVPLSTLPQPTSPLGPSSDDNSVAPSQANLLMAAAEMHKMGRLVPKPTKPKVV